MCALSHVRLFETPRTVAHQAPVSMGFPRQEYWSGLPGPPSGDFLHTGIKPTSPALQVDSLPVGSHFPLLIRIEVGFQVWEKIFGIQLLLKETFNISLFLASSLPQPLQRYRVPNSWIFLVLQPESACLSHFGHFGFSFPYWLNQWPFICFCPVQFCQHVSSAHVFFPV